MRTQDMARQEHRHTDDKPRQPYFRDLLPIEDESGRRRWIYPKRPQGRLYNYRWAVAAVLLLLFFAAPFVRVKGEPLVLLNFLERKFVLLGQVFWPQDLHLLALALIALLVFIILFTVVYGRVFCGWACPQTIFMEFVFRQVEYLIEGDAHRQKKLNERGWSIDKALRKTLKHLVFIVLALVIAHTATAYVVGADAVGSMIRGGVLANPGNFVFIMAFAGLVYFIFSSLREQACILICPYGRLQGVLLDDRSVVVAYDYVRGEPRAAYRASADRAAAGNGDCVDCLSCVSVCPTGIDIRNGTQLECINCTACIDACNAVMDRVKLARGLVRFDSERGISTGKRSIVNGRSLAYSAVLLILLTVTASLFISRSDIEATILRMPGSIYQEYGPDRLSNLYKIQVVNKQREDIPVELRVSHPGAEILFIGEPVAAAGGKISEANFMVVIPREKLLSENTEIIIELLSGGSTLTAYKTNFIGPVPAGQHQNRIQ